MLTRDALIAELRDKLGREPSEYEIADLAHEYAQKEAVLEAEKQAAVEAARKEELAQSNEAETKEAEEKDAKLNEAAAKEAELKKLEAELAAGKQVEGAKEQEAKTKEAASLEAAAKKLDAELAAAKQAEGAKEQEAKTKEAAALEAEAKRVETIEIAPLVANDIDATRQAAGSEIQPAAGSETVITTDMLPDESVLASRMTVVDEQIEHVDAVAKVGEIASDATELVEDFAELHSQAVASHQGTVVHEGPTPLHSVHSELPGGSAALTVALVGVATAAYLGSAGAPEPTASAVTDEFIRQTPEHAKDLLAACASIETGTNPEALDALRNTYALNAIISPELYPSLDPAMDAEIAPYVERLQAFDERVIAGIDAGIVPEDMLVDLRASATNELAADFACDHRCATWDEVHDVATQASVSTSDPPASSSIEPSVAMSLGIEPSSNNSVSAATMVEHKAEADKDVVAEWKAASVVVTATTGVGLSGGMM